MAINCPKCGYENLSPERGFCYNCGRPLESLPSMSLAPRSSYSSPVKPAKLVIAVLVLLVVFAVILGIGAAITTSPSDDGNLPSQDDNPPQNNSPPPNKVWFELKSIDTTEFLKVRVYFDGELVIDNRSVRSHEYVGEWVSFPGPLKVDISTDFTIIDRDYRGIFEGYRNSSRFNVCSIDGAGILVHIGYHDSLTVSYWIEEIPPWLADPSLGPYHS